jgi:hypothetical protein
LLAACGGGGDASQPPQAFTGTPAKPAGETGFVPTATTAGRVLHDDATTLRPLTDEALWVYRGVQGSGLRATTFTSFRQTVARGAGFEERLSSPLSATSGVTEIHVANGQVQRQSNLGLPDGLLPNMVTELRSPVREGDQFTWVDQQGVQLSQDQDGDGQADQADVAVYARVIGEQEVDLPELNRALTAVRVDVTAVTRLHLSGSSTPQAPSTLVESTWYAPGVGIVRRTRSQASAGTIGEPGPVATDERLQYFDGVSQGLGLVPSQAVAHALGSPSAGPWLAASVDAVASGDQVFVLSPRAAQGQQAAGATLSVMDSQGRVITSAEHPQLQLPTPSSDSDSSGMQLLPVPQGVALVQAQAGGFMGMEILDSARLLRFDARGQALDARWLDIAAVPGSLKAAADGQTIWAVWVEPTLDGRQRQLSVRRFDGAGSAQGASQVLATLPTSTAVQALAIRAAEGRALVSWQLAGAASAWQAMQAWVPAQGPAQVATLPAAGAFHAQPLLSAGLAVLSWAGNQPDSWLNGVVLAPAQPQDGGSSPSWTPAGGNLEAAPTSLAAPAGVQPGAHALGIDDDRLLWATSGSARLSTQETAQERFLGIAQVRPKGQTLADAAVEWVRFRDRSPAASTAPEVARVRQVLTLEDRWLILGDDGQRLTVAVLFKR